MNCFEARRDFRAFWRRTLAPAAQAELSGHLERCPVCDRAWRAFALTAPLLHSEPREFDITEHIVNANGHDSDLTFQTNRKSHGKRPGWTAVCASISIVAAAGLAAYLANAAPKQTLADALTSQSPYVELIGSHQTPSTPLFDNFAG